MVLGMAALAAAHHSAAGVDRTKSVTVNGIVKEFRWTNPHSWIYWAVYVNPVTFGVAAVRRALYASDPGVNHLPAYSISIGFSLLFAVATCIAASVLVQRRPKGAA
jgi:hypothetical protein